MDSRNLGGRYTLIYLSRGRERVKVAQRSKRFLLRYTKNLYYIERPETIEENVQSSLSQFLTVK